MDNLQIDWQIKSYDELSKDELYQLIRLRIQVFVVEQNCPYQECDDEDQAAWHLTGYLKNKPVAYLRIIPTKDYIKIGRVLTDINYRKKNLGKALMKKSLEYIDKKYAGSEIRISAQTYLIKFYQELDFNIVGKEYLEDDIPHIQMIRK